MEIRNVGVVGCGQMGSGIALVCAQSGYRVTVSEINDALLQKGLDSIDATLSRSVAKGRLSPQDQTAILNCIRGTTSLKDFSSCDLVIEAVAEDLVLKQQLMAELDAICPKDTILASNTSCLSIKALAQATTHPDRVLGLHFFNPVTSMRLAEIVTTPQTSAETLKTARQFIASLGKQPVLAQDSPGFIVNHLMVPFLLNAIRLLESGMATREDIDTAITLGLNHPLGPLALADLIGLDIVLSMGNSLYWALKDPQYAAPALLKEMVSRGWLGRKSGKGFYDYDTPVLRK